MRTIQDFEHFTLQPGETLILRCKHTITAQQYQDARNYLDNAGLGKILIIGPEFDVMAGMIEVLGAGAPEPEDIEAARADIEHAYEEGSIIEFKPVADASTPWISAHRYSSPHVFDWNQNVYRLPVRK